MNRDSYLEFHRERYRLLLDKVAGSLSRCGGREPNVLVVGPSHETRLLAERFPAASIDTLGIFDARYPAPSGRHYEMDLNVGGAASMGPYHLIVAAEVIEHLQTSPQAVFKFLRGALRPGGEMIVQTPNAASLAKRANEVILKVVNVSTADLETDLQFEGGRILPATTATVLASDKPEDENTLEQPAKVKPFTRKLNDAGAAFRHTFPANSVTVLRLKLQ